MCFLNKPSPHYSEAKKLERKKEKPTLFQRFTMFLCISFYYFHAIFVYLCFWSYVKEYKIVCVNEIIWIENMFNIE